MIRHAIIDSSQTPAPVINVVEYETDITGETPPGFAEPLRALATYDTPVSPGWVYDGTTFYDPNPPDVVVPPRPGPSPQTEVLYEHENRLLVLEGQPPISFVQFVTSKKL